MSGPFQMEVHQIQRKRHKIPSQTMCYASLRRKQAADPGELSSPGCRTLPPKKLVMSPAYWCVEHDQLNLEPNDFDCATLIMEPHGRDSSSLGLPAQVFGKHVSFQDGAGRVKHRVGMDYLISWKIRSNDF